MAATAGIIAGVLSGLIGAGSMIILCIGAAILMIAAITSKTAMMSVMVRDFRLISCDGVSLNGMMIPGMANRFGYRWFQSKHYDYRGFSFFR